MTESAAGAMLRSFEGHEPRIDPGAWAAPGSTLIGDVHLGADASVWYTAVLRADGDRIVIGEGSNIQDGTVVHTDVGFPVVVGSGVSVGHRVVLHGCSVGDDVLVGMGAVLMNGSRIGAGSIVAAGALVLEGMDVPPGSLVAGVPGKVRRELHDGELETIRDNARIYRDLTVRHAAITS